LFFSIIVIKKWKSYTYNKFSTKQTITLHSSQCNKFKKFIKYSLFNFNLIYIINLQVILMYWIWMKKLFFTTIWITTDISLYFIIINSFILISFLSWNIWALPILCYMTNLYVIEIINLQVILMYGIWMKKLCLKIYICEQNE